MVGSDGPGVLRRVATVVTVVALVAVEVLAASTVGLWARQTTQEGRVIEAVRTFRSRSL